MKEKINKILFINTGGGIGDALSCLPTFNYINKILSPEIIYYYATDLNNYWFEEKLLEYKPVNLSIIKNFPEHFGFRDFHKKDAEKLINKFDFNEFDLIIDNQTRLKNTLIYRKIPHKYYVSPCINYFLSKPFKFIKKSKSISIRIIDYLNKLTNNNEMPNYSIDISKSFLDEAKKLIKNDKKYIGFSITAGHKTRNKEIKFDEIIKVAKYFSDKYIPTFFIEDKYIDLKEKIKKSVGNSYFPEEQINKIYKKPMMVTALGSLTSFNISIDNGISHMLSFSKNKNFIIYNDYSKKFKPINKNCFIFDCKINNTSIDQITSESIINFIRQYLN